MPHANVDEVVTAVLLGGRFRAHALLELGVDVLPVHEELQMCVYQTMCPSSRGGEHDCVGR